MDFLEGLESGLDKIDKLGAVHGLAPFGKINETVDQSEGKIQHGSLRRRKGDAILLRPPAPRRFGNSTPECSKRPPSAVTDMECARSAARFHLLRRKLSAKKQPLLNAVAFQAQGSSIITTTPAAPAQNWINLRGGGHLIHSHLLHLFFPASDPRSGPGAG